MKFIRIFLSNIFYRIGNFLEYDDYYIRVKDDFTGEEYFVMDWIKSHNEQIGRLQDEMIWVKYQIDNINKSIADLINKDG